MKYELPSTELIVIEENNYLKFGEYLNDMQCDDTANKLSLDDLEYVKKLQQENKKLNSSIQTYDILLKANVEENKQLKRIIKENTILVKDEYGDYQECNINPLRIKQKYDKQVNNWNKLKKWLEKSWAESQDIWFVKIINKMQELEQGSDNQ